MRMTKLLIPTLKEDPSDAEVVSHRLMVRAGMIVGGLGLLRYKEWARILTLVASFLSLPHVPFGTALGIYSMIVLFNPETVRLFQGGAAAPPPSAGASR